VLELFAANARKLDLGIQQLILAMDAAEGGWRERFDTPRTVRKSLPF
jgi:hypothetical protein